MQNVPGTNIYFAASFILHAGSGRGCSSESTLPHNNTSRLLHYADVILGTSKPEKFEPSKPIPYQRLDLDANWEIYHIHHDLTDLGIKKFVADHQALSSRWQLNRDQSDKTPLPHRITLSSNHKAARVTCGP